MVKILAVLSILNSSGACSGATEKVAALVARATCSGASRRGRVDDFSFFDYLSPFCVLLIEFHCSFSISIKILPNYVYYYCISIRM